MPYMLYLRTYMRREGYCRISETEEEHFSLICSFRFTFQSFIVNYDFIPSSGLCRTYIWVYNLLTKILKIYMMYVPCVDILFSKKEKKSCVQFVDFKCAHWHFHVHWQANWRRCVAWQGWSTQWAMQSIISHIKHDLFHDSVISHRIRLLWFFIAFIM